MNITNIVNLTQTMTEKLSELMGHPGHTGLSIKDESVKTTENS